MRTREELVDLGERAVKLALAKGASAAEAYVVESLTTTVAAAGRHIAPSGSNHLGIGVRLALDGRVGLSGTTSAEGMPRAVEEALRSVRDAGAEGGGLVLPGPQVDALPRVSVDASLREDRAEGTAAIAEAAMSAALARRDVTYASLSVVSSVRSLVVVNSSGLLAHDETGFERMELELRCTRGTTHRSGTDAHSAALALERTFDPAAFVSSIVDRVVSGLEPQPLSGPHVEEAIFLPGPASQILGMVGSVFAARGKGERGGAARTDGPAFAPCITLRDAPRGPEGARRRNVDDEGVPTRPHVLVEKGQLATLLHDARSAATAGVAPTGNGMRAAPSSNVTPRALNVAMDAGDHTLDELVEGASRAVLVPEALLGGFTHNQATGDFSVVVPYAFLVENGRVRHALPPTTVAGNAYRVLRETRALGRERRTYSGGTLPALRAGGVSCAT